MLDIVVEELGRGSEQGEGKSRVEVKGLEAHLHCLQLAKMWQCFKAISSIKVYSWEGVNR
jgi:hypothetical protein